MAKDLKHLWHAKYQGFEGEWGGNFNNYQYGFLDFVHSYGIE